MTMILCICARASREGRVVSSRRASMGESMRAFVFLATLSGLGLLVTPALGTEPDPTEIIAKADQATKAVKAISYKAKIWTESELKLPQPRIEATIKAKENAPGKAPLFWIDGVATLPQRGTSSAFNVILNDTQAAMVDEQEKVCTIGELPEAFELVLQPLKTVVMQELLHQEQMQAQIG